jgi:adenylyltransferase/sulfurtransferase
MPLSKLEIERYKRQLAVDGWDQERLRRARVLVVGAGGLGGISASYLAAAGVGRLRICDSDKVELSNLNRQILYTEADIGRPKAPLAAKRLMSLNPEIEIDAVLDTVSEDNAAELASGCDLIVDGLDNHADRLILNKASFDLRIPYVYGAINGWLGQLSLFNPPTTACLACLMPGEMENSGPPRNPESSQNPEPSQKSGPTPVFGALAAAVGSLQATLALRYLMTGENPAANTLLILRADTMSLERVTFERRPGCVVCGGAEPSGPRR